MTTRRGSLMLDMVGAFTALGLISLVMVGVAADRQHQARQERRAAALEQAQNLLAVGRRTGTIPENPGWTCTRRVRADGVIELRVHSREVSLSTLLAATAAEEKP